MNNTPTPISTQLTLFTGWLGIGGLALALATPVQAGPIQTQSISYAGSACSANAIDISGNTETKLVFRNWRNTGVERGNCSISIPVNVPQGMQVGLPTVTYKGKAIGALLTTETFFAGEKGIMTSYPINNTFTIKDVNLGWSPCGSSVNIRVNVGLMNHIGTGRLSSLTLSKLPSRRCY